MTPSHKNPIFIIGLDSCDPDLFQRWSKEGRLPFLTSLISSGTWSRLLSSRGLFSDSPWPSFNTGVTPGRHGFYNFLQLKRGTTELKRMDGRYCRYLPFWWLLRNSRKKVAVLDVPKTSPLPGIDGIQVAGWGEHYPLLKQSSLPAPLVEEINARFGQYRHPHEVVDPKTISLEVKKYNQMLAGIDQRLEVMLYLLEQDDWDLFFSVFAESHYGGHQLYHHSDPSHWAHDPHRAKRLQESLPHVYLKLDGAVGEFFRHIPEGATYFIVSVHGIETNYSANDLMPSVLERLGFQVPASHGQTSMDPFPGPALLRKLRDLVPQSVRDFINERLVPEALHDRNHFRWFSQHLDWKRSKAFFLPSDHFQGFISLNLEGREPWGCVRPGAEYQEMCDQVAHELGQLLNPATGNRAIDEVVQISRIYPGENATLLPDLVLRWSNEAPIEQLYHPRFGVLSRQGFKLRKSQHAPDGFMIAGGKNIKPGALLNGATTMDLAPTILYLMGEAVPHDMDGKVLFDLIDEEFKEQHPVRYENRPLVVPEEMRP